jgi:hypothetical protein
MKGRIYTSGASRVRVEQLGGGLKRFNSRFIRLFTTSVVGWVLGGEAAATPPPTEDSLVLFEELVRNSDDVRANLAYARALVADGRIEEGRRIYQKILTLRPNDPDASAALALLSQAAPPAQTDYTFRTGGAIETNDARRDPNFKPFFDTLGFAEFTVADLRQFGDVKLQSNVDIFSNTHNRYSPGNVSYFAIDSGPLFDLQGNGKLRAAIGANTCCKEHRQSTVAHLGNLNSTPAM